MTTNPTGAARSISPRVLFTGFGLRVIENLMEQIPPRYTAERCPVRDNSLQDALKKLRPHAVVVCLQDEAPHDYKSYRALEEAARGGQLPVFVVGRDTDCAAFQKAVLISSTIVMERPLNTALLLSTLHELTENAVAREVEKTAEDAATASAAAAAEAAQAALLESKKKAMATQSTAGKAAERSLSHLADTERRKSILVVDDDIRMLNVIKSHLEDLYDVTVVPSGKLALKYLSKRSADLVLLDYLMPEMDGPAVLSEIRMSSPHPNVPVLFLTGVSDKDMVLRGLEFNPNGYLLKPVTQSVLLERVMELLLGLS